MQTRDHKKRRSIYPSKSLTMLSHSASIEWLSANRLPRPTIPVDCVALIALLAM
jgi:hypothetical protein